MSKIPHPWAVVPAEPSWEGVRRVATGPCFVQEPAADVWAHVVYAWEGARIVRQETPEGEGEAPSIARWFEIVGAGQVWSASGPSVLPDALAELAPHDVLLEEEFFGTYSAAADGGDPSQAVGQPSEREDRLHRLELDRRINRWFHLACGLGCGFLGAFLGALDLAYVLWAAAGAIVATLALDVGRTALARRRAGPD
jgi:hypothetical protein